MSHPRTLIVSDQHFNAECLHAMLSTFQSIKVLNSIGNIASSCKLYIDNEVDVVLIDVYQNSSQEEIKLLFNHFKSAKKLVLSYSSDRNLLSEMIQLGADGCFLKNVHPCRLCEAILTMCNNDFYLPDELHEMLYPKLNTPFRLEIQSNSRMA